MDFNILDKRIIEFLETHSVNDIMTPTHGYMLTYNTEEYEYLYGDNQLIIFERGATNGTRYKLK